MNRRVMEHGYAIEPPCIEQTSNGFGWSNRPVGTCECGINKNTDIKNGRLEQLAAKTSETLKSDHAYSFSCKTSTGGVSIVTFGQVVQSNLNLKKKLKLSQQKVRRQEKYLLARGKDKLARNQVMNLKTRIDRLVLQKGVLKKKLGMAQQRVRRMRNTIESLKVRVKSFMNYSRQEACDEAVDIMQLVCREDGWLEYALV